MDEVKGTTSESLRNLLERVGQPILYRLFFFAYSGRNGRAAVSHYDIESACKELRFHLLARGFIEADDEVCVTTLLVLKVPDQHCVPAGEIMVECISSSLTQG